MFTRGGEEISFLVTALPLGYAETMEEMIPSPKAPKKGFLRDHKQKIIRDGNGIGLPFLDEDDPVYIKELNRVNKAQTMFMVHKALEKDTNVEWCAKREDFPEGIEFYEALFCEMKEIGITMGEFGQLIECVSKLSNLDVAEIEEARNLFLSQE